MSAAPIYVQAVGMACPVGLTADSACAAMRAGIDRRQLLPYTDNAGEPITGSYLASLGNLAEEAEPSTRLTRRERWMQLLVYAIKDLARQLGADGIPGIICVLPAEPDGEPPPAAGVAEELSARLGIALEASALQVISGGSWCGFSAIAQARALLQHHGHSAVLVCAADSLINARSLLRLSEQGRLLTEENSDGVTPGEAAACVLLKARSANALATIRGVGFGEEPALLDNDVPLRGDGVVAAAKQALAEARGALHDVDFRVSDAAGESYHFKEQVLVMSRLLRQRKQTFPLRLAAETLGDVGVAAGLCGVAWTTTAFARGWAPGRAALAWAGSEGAQRAALVLTRD